mgnify:CR=1 FL=1
MRLSDEEQAMLAGEMGPACRWAIDHQLQVGRMFDAADMVPVSQAHMMADPESLGEAGVGRATLDAWLRDNPVVRLDGQQDKVFDLTEETGTDAVVAMCAAQHADDDDAGATAGGRTRPASSECVITSAPISRVETCYYLCYRSF